MRAESGAIGGFGRDYFLRLDKTEYYRNLLSWGELGYRKCNDLADSTLSFETR